MKLNSTRMSSRIQVTFLWISVTVLICIIHACLGAGDEAKKNGDIHDTQAETNSILVSSISITKYSGNSHVKAEIPRFECHGEEKECEKDRLGFDAIRNLHLMIDDDHNGNVDLSESDEGRWS